MKGSGRVGAGGAIGLQALLVLVLAATQLPAAESVACIPSQLIPCSNAFFQPVRPSVECCAKVREQLPCFCQYLRNPALRNYINSPGTRRVAASCGVSYPRC